MAADPVQITSAAATAAPGVVVAEEVSVAWLGTAYFDVSGALVDFDFGSGAATAAILLLLSVCARLGVWAMSQLLDYNHRAGRGGD